MDIFSWLQVISLLVRASIFREKCVTCVKIVSCVKERLLYVWLVILVLEKQLKRPSRNFAVLIRSRTVVLIFRLNTDSLATLTFWNSYWMAYQNVMAVGWWYVYSIWYKIPKWPLKVRNFSLFRAESAFIKSS